MHKHKGGVGLTGKWGGIGQVGGLGWGLGREGEVRKEGEKEGAKSGKRERAQGREQIVVRVLFWPRLSPSPATLGV